MRKIQIITDSCSDLPAQLREKYGIDYARMKTVYKGEEQWASLDFEYYTPKQLYDIMRGGERVYTTQVPAEEYERIFGEYLEQGCDIVYIGCCLKQSGSVNTAAVVARKLHEKYTDAQIYCIDSLNASLGEGMLAIRAAQYRDGGMTVKLIYESILADRNLVNEYVTVHSLDMLHKSGRVKASAAFFGNLFGVKPIIISDYYGNQTPLKKVKGRRVSLEEIVDLLKDSIVDPEGQTVYIAHADCESEALEVKAMVEEKIPCKDVFCGYIGPIIGSSIGPDAIGVWGMGKEITFGKED